MPRDFEDFGKPRAIEDRAELDIDLVDDIADQRFIGGGVNRAPAGVPSRTNLRLASAPMTPMPPVNQNPHVSLLPPLSSSAKADDPVATVRSAITGCSACAEHDSSCYPNVGTKQFFDRNRLRDQTLLDHIVDQRFQRRPVRLDAVRPAIAGRTIRRSPARRPAATVAVTQRPRIAHLLPRPVLRRV